MRHIQLALALAILASPALAQSSRSAGEALVKAQCAPCHAIARTGASELMVTANIFDHEKRKRSFSIAAGAHGGLKAAA